MKMALNVAAVLGLVSAALGIDTDRLRVQRKEVFAFTEKPTLTRRGDAVTIRFAVKDFCDVTIAVEDSDGTILRHLASGVLGPNAPEPFRKNTSRQEITWDGKDELGAYVDDRDRLSVRVSLGLKARFERTLWWSAQKTALSKSYVLMAAAPEGVYVLYRGTTTQLILYDHAGDYVRTVYPFPAKQIKQVKGIKWIAFPPDGERLPSKLINHDQDTFLPDDDGRDLAVWGDRVALAGAVAVRLTTDGASWGGDLKGPIIGYKIGSGKNERFVRPHSVAFSPDGKRLYCTAYSWQWSKYGYHRRSWFHGVSVLDVASGTVAVFAGEMKTKGFGSDDRHFTCPASVDCDGKGRVYVADNFNSRVQVFLPDGTFYKTIKTPRPGIVRVNRGTGEVCAISSGMSISDDIGKKARGGGGNVARFYASADDPTLKAAYPLAVPGNSYYRGHSIYDCNVEVDFHTDPPTIWTSVAPDHRAEHPRCAIRLWRPKDRKLVKVRDFGAEAQRRLIRPRTPRHGRPRLYVNQVTGLLYVARHTQDTAVACKSFKELIKIDPATGRAVLEQLPTDPEDMDFDAHGYAYLRTFDAITRFDPATWKEAPYDYGTQRMVFNGAGGGGERPFRAAGAVSLPSTRGGSFHMGGFGVSPLGTAVVSCINPGKRSNVRRTDSVGGSNERGGYTPVGYPGRHKGYETHVFDWIGKLVKDDAVPGIGKSTALQIDRHGYVYILAASTPYLNGKPYFNGRGCTLVKLKPGKMKALSAGGTIPLAKEGRPKRPMDMTRPGLWIEGAEWMFGPVGAEGHYGSGGKCSCYVNGRFVLDYYGRSFAPEIDRFRAVVLDTNGNVMMRMGHYGNVEDGLPLVKKGGPPVSRSIGGDELALMHAQNVAVHTDHRFFLADIGNQCIRSVKLDYHTTERRPLKDLTDDRS